MKNEEVTSLCQCGRGYTAVGSGQRGPEFEYRWRRTLRHPRRMDRKALNCTSHLLGESSAATLNPKSVLRVQCMLEFQCVLTAQEVLNICSIAQYVLSAQCVPLLSLTVCHCPLLLCANGPLLLCATVPLLLCATSTFLLCTTAPSHCHCPWHVV